MSILKKSKEFLTSESRNYPSTLATSSILRNIPLADLQTKLIRLGGDPIENGKKQEVALAIKAACENAPTRKRRGGKDATEDEDKNK